MNANYTCPVCGYQKLKSKPYKNMPSDWGSKSVAPPYSVHWGEASYEVCPCCSYEFGLDDTDGGADLSFNDYLKYWVTEEACNWNDTEKKPKNWSLEGQLKEAGIELPGDLLFLLGCK